MGQRFCDGGGRINPFVESQAAIEWAIPGYGAECSEAHGQEAIRARPCDGFPDHAATQTPPLMAPVNIDLIDVKPFGYRSRCQKRDHLTLYFAHPQGSGLQVRGPGIRWRIIAQQVWRDIPTFKCCRCGQLYVRQFWKIVGDGVTDVYGSGSCDDRSVCATTPFGPRSIVDRDVVSAKAGQCQGQHRGCHAGSTAGDHGA